MITCFFGREGFTWFPHGIVFFNFFTSFKSWFSIILYLFISFFVSLADFPLLLIYAPPFPVPDSFIFLIFYIVFNFLIFSLVNFPLVLFYFFPSTTNFLYFIIFSVFFFPRKLFIRVILIMALSPPNPIIFLPVFGGREFYMVTSE